MLDIYSCYIVHWEIWPTENGELAKAFIENAIIRNGGVASTIHADRVHP